MTEYYTDNLSARRLMRCYEIASTRVQAYLGAEVAHVVSRLTGDDDVLELGCGYGRVAGALARNARRVVGIDVSLESLVLAREFHGPGSGCQFFCMDASTTGFRPASFDAVVCVQNGICAFAVEPTALVAEAVRLLRPGGVALFSTYADAFWEHRLLWFEAQSAEGLLGPIDYDKTGDGVIACRDGFRSARLTPEELRRVCDSLALNARIYEVDGSSVFCQIGRA